MEYVCCNVRYLFFNGVKRYTVSFIYSLSSWYIFEGQRDTGAVFIKKINKAKIKVDKHEAEYWLLEFLETELNINQK